MTQVSGEIIKRAPSILIEYDPHGDTGTIIFRLWRYLLQDDGEYLKVDRVGNVQRDFSDIMTQTFEAGDDPVTGADLSQVSAAGVMAIIKQALEDFQAEDEASGEEGATR